MEKIITIFNYSIDPFDFDASFVLKELDEHLNDYVERATGSMARSVSISGSDSQSGASKKEGDEATNQSGENNEEPEIIIETEEPPQVK